jgi:hypothetical protein
VTSRKQGDALPAEVADAVVEHVLYDNYLQAQILSQEVAASAARIRDYEDLMLALEAQGLLDRAIEELPSSEEMAERERSGDGMARPELAVLLAYAKLSLKTAILGWPADDHTSSATSGLSRAIVGAGDSLTEHRPANDRHDGGEGRRRLRGRNSRCRLETARSPSTSPAYRIARDVTAAVERWEAIEALDGVIDTAVQNELMTRVDWVVDHRPLVPRTRRAPTSAKTSQRALPGSPSRGRPARSPPHGRRAERRRRWSPGAPEARDRVHARARPHPTSSSWCATPTGRRGSGAPWPGDLTSTG